MSASNGKDAVPLILAVFCGLPGSGKSNLCQLLKNDCSSRCTVNHCPFKKEPSQHKFSYLVVCYDFLMGDPSDLGQQVGPQVGDGDSGLSHWKSARSCIVGAVDQLLSDTKPVVGIDSPDAGVSLSNHAVQELKSKIESYNRPSTDSSTTIDPTALTVIIIDDNMYYRSMRREYLKMARKYNVGFCQVYLKCPLELALQRNRCRRIRVADDVITNMHKKIEEPVESESLVPGSQLTFVIDHGKDDSRNFCCCELKTFFNYAFENPVPPLIEDKEKILSREICIKNFIHQADQAMRKILSDIINEQRGTSGSKELSEQAKRINRIRQTVLDRIREEKLEVPPNLIAAVADGSLHEIRDSLYSFLRDVIHKELDSSSVHLLTGKDCD